jgi:hypothetical protein
MLILDRGYGKHISPWKSCRIFLCLISVSCSKSVIYGSLSYFASQRWHCRPSSKIVKLNRKPYPPRLSVRTDSFQMTQLKYCRLNAGRNDSINRLTEIRWRLDFYLARQQMTTGSRRTPKTLCISVTVSHTVRSTPMNLYRYAVPGPSRRSPIQVLTEFDNACLQ